MEGLAFMRSENLTTNFPSLKFKMNYLKLFIKVNNTTFNNYNHFDN